MSVARAHVASDIERRAVLGRASNAFPRQTRLVDLTQVTCEYTRRIVLRRVRCAYAFPRVRITCNRVALVHWREGAVLGLPNTVARLANTVDFAKIFGRARCAIPSRRDVAHLEVLVTEDRRTRIGLDPTTILISARTRSFTITLIRDRTKLAVVARSSLGRIHHDTCVDRARYLPRVAHSNQTRRGFDQRTVLAARSEIPTRTAAARAATATAARRFGDKAFRRGVAATKTPRDNGEQDQQPMSVSFTGEHKHIVPISRRRTNVESNLDDFCTAPMAEASIRP